VQIKEAIQELTQWLESYQFELSQYSSNNRTTPLIKEWKELMTKVSDNQSLVASLKDSKFGARFADQIGKIEEVIYVLDSALHNLNVIQRKWIYLEPIFSRGALPEQQQKFLQADGDYRAIMTAIGKRNSLYSVTPAVASTLESLLGQFDFF